MVSLAVDMWGERGFLLEEQEDLFHPEDVALQRALKTADPLLYDNAFQHLLANRLQRALKTFDCLEFKAALQHLLSVALHRAPRPGFKDDSEYVLFKFDKPVNVLQRALKRFDLLGFKNALQHLQAEVDERLTPLHRALKLPDLSGLNDGDQKKPDSRRKGSATGDTKRHEVLKRGLSGTIDGLKVSALADTGAAQNVLSSNFAGARKLDVAGSPSSFKQGNSKLAHSLGTVNVRWAFADKPTETIEVVCHVISNCAYDVILGRRFLSMTETFTKYKHRLTKCLSSAAGVLRINLLDRSRQFLEGTLGDTYKTNAVPDTGAEGNVMDLRYTEEHSFNIKRGAKNRRVLEFADGSRQRAVGQVKTSWTFDSGQRIPLRFEVLEDCLHDVILGEEVLWEYDVFETYAASIRTLPSDTDSFDLAPFSFVPGWVQKISGANKPNRECKGHNNKPIDLNALELEERRRRDFWNHQYNFNSGNASEAERDAERERRRQYEERLALARLTLEGRGPSAPESHVQSIPSIPTAPNTPH